MGGKLVAGLAAGARAFEGDEAHQPGELLDVSPMVELGDLVGPEDPEQVGAWVFLAERSGCANGVAGRFEAEVDVGALEARFVLGGAFDHFHSLPRRAGGSVVLQGGLESGNEEDALQIELLASVQSDDQMPVVDRVEAAANYSNAPSHRAKVFWKARDCQ